MHNNSPEQMPILHSPAPDLRTREKLEGGQRLVMHTEFRPAGDQPTAIAELTQGIKEGEQNQVLLGATGTGKTYTMAKVIEETQRPAIILAPNKTLAAQLYGEFKGFFPENAVEYFVSYYDYYQPEAYVPRSDTSTGCATRPPALCWNATTSSSSPRSPASTASARSKPTVP